MKRKLAATVVLLLIATVSFAEERNLEPTQKPDAPYRLFATHNIYTFLKLDTGTGKIWQVQWGEDKEHRFTVPLNLDKTLPSGKPGRFTLYPTTNVYTFVLLDQETGDTWQVQWGKSEDRFVEHIRD